jgi:hypothetical protein
LSWSAIVVLAIDIDDCIEVNAEDGSILADVVVVLDLQVVVRATVGVGVRDGDMVVAVDVDRTRISGFSARPPRCETKATPTPTPGRLGGLTLTSTCISSTGTVTQRPLGRRPGHVHSGGGGGLSVRHRHQPETVKQYNTREIVK